MNHMHRKGVALILVLMLLAIATAAFATLTKQHHLRIERVQMAKESLQTRWAQRSCEVTLLKIAPELLDAQGLLAFEVKLGQMPWRVQLANEHVKVPIQTLAHHSHANQLAELMGISNRTRLKQLASQTAPFDPMWLVEIDGFDSLTAFGDKRLDAMHTPLNMLDLWLGPEITMQHLALLRESLVAQQKPYDLARACRSAHIPTQLIPLCMEKLSLDIQCFSVWIQPSARTCPDIYTVVDMTKPAERMLRFYLPMLPPIEVQP